MTPFWRRAATSSTPPQTRRVTDEMFIEAAHALADQVTPSQLQQGLLYPPQSDILETEIKVAARVAKVVFDSNLARVARQKDCEAFIRSHVQAGIPQSRVRRHPGLSSWSSGRQATSVRGRPLTMTWWVSKLRGGWLLPFVLSTTAGAVDVIGFLALAGLFTAHITGNVVILAAHYVTGGFSEVGPLLSVPVFVVVLGVVTLACGTLERAGYGSRRPLLALQAAFLAGCLWLGVGLGPFANADSPTAVLVGMLAVAAMAIQNALVKLALPGAPSTAVMTTNATQLTIELATLLWSRGKPEDLVQARCRAGVIFPAVVGFVAGCAAGAVLEVHCGLWALALPLTLSALAVSLGWGEN
jgi:uncharacterized membrane protein YoaK (UPF0700 family)